MTPLLGTSPWTGTTGGGCDVGSMAMWVQLRWLPNLGAEGRFEAPRWALGKGFKVTCSVDWTLNLGSCHLDNTVTGDLGKQPPLL